MPLQPNTITVPVSGLDQKTARLTRRAGTLDRCVNAEFDKGGEAVVIRKRRGYQRVDPSNTVNRFDTDTIMTSVTTLGSELVVFTYGYVAAIGSRDALLRGADSLVYRGPCNRGACQVGILAASRLSQDVEDDT